MRDKKASKIIFGIFFILLLTACGDSDDNSSEDNGEVDYGEEVNYTITGIEPGAGISVTTERALEEYDNLEGWEVELSSTGAMMAE
ncbi:hypothetical protein [Oceanobacillus sp. FSL W7-1281]|uniref:hypothetical protein n=1 Tax=Oceanobacillus sp. FSL W7-1281 TaxID=2921698 RepID=UPI0030DB597A